MPRVRVRAYIRDGIRVRSHTRRSPGRTAATISVTAGIVTATYSPSTGINVARSDPESRARSARAVSIEAQAGFRRAETRLVVSGYKVRLATSFDTDCAAHSYGRVHKFFESHPCKWLARSYIQINGFEVLISISWVMMPNIHLAKRYKHLIDTPDAGNITELSRDTKLYRRIQYTTSTYISGIHGAAVWNVQVQPILPTSIATVNNILEDSRQ